MLAATPNDANDAAGFTALDLWLTFMSSPSAALALGEDWSIAEAGAELQALSRDPFVFIGFVDSESESFVCVSTEGCTFDRPGVKEAFVRGPLEILLGILLSGHAEK